jgi:hypothetical protein
VTTAGMPEIVGLRSEYIITIVLVVLEMSPLYFTLMTIEESAS